MRHFIYKNLRQMWLMWLIISMIFQKYQPTFSCPDFACWISIPVFNDRLTSEIVREHFNTMATTEPLCLGWSLFKDCFFKFLLDVLLCVLSDVYYKLWSSFTIMNSKHGSTDVSLIVVKHNISHFCAISYHS